MVETIIPIFKSHLWFFVRYIKVLILKYKIQRLFYFYFLRWQMSNYIMFKSKDINSKRKLHTIFYYTVPYFGAFKIRGDCWSMVFLEGFYRVDLSWFNSI